MKTLLLTVSILALLASACGSEIEGGVDDSLEALTSAPKTKPGAPAAPPAQTVTLTVGVNPNMGTGTITSSPALVNCSTSRCTYTVPVGMQITLIPSGPNVMRGWEGSYCVGNANCLLTMSFSKYAVADFGCVAGQADFCGCASEPCCGDACAQGLSCSDLYGWGQVSCN